MPRGDGTGPRVMGTETGREAGRSGFRQGSAEPVHGNARMPERMDRGLAAGGIGMTILDLFLAWFERISRK